MTSTNLMLFVVAFILTATAQAKDNKLTYDLGASTGSYDGENYNEINLGFNWLFGDYWTWRNSAFSRTYPTRSSYGLDSSMRFAYETDSQSPIGLGFFAGPGVRLSDNRGSGVFFEAGLSGRAGGLRLGGGFKTIQYTSPGNNTDGSSRGKTDTTYFITVSGGGVIN